MGKVLLGFRNLLCEPLRKAFDSSFLLIVIRSKHTCLALSVSIAWDLSLACTVLPKRVQNGAHHSTPCPGSPSASTPSQAATVAPTSAKEERIPRSRGSPPPATSSGTRSRV